MKIAIMADLHDNAEYLRIFLNYCKKEKVETILCVGDITTQEVLVHIDKNIDCPMYYIAGNAEIFTDKEAKEQKLKNITYLGRTGIIELANKKIGLCHEPEFIEKLLKEKPNIIFHGHTHKPWLEKKNNSLIVNPGTLGGFSYQSTFAVWDTEKEEPELILSNLLEKM